MKAKTTVLGLLAGAALLLPTANEASADLVVLQAADPTDTIRTYNRGGVEEPRCNDEEHTTEMANFSFDTTDPTKGIVVSLFTGQLDGPGPGTNDGQQRPQNNNANVQGACFPVQMVQSAESNTGVTIQPDQSNYKYITNRSANESRTFHFPQTYALGNGLHAVEANWQRRNSNNTERFLQVVDSQCNLVPLTSNVRLYEDNTAARVMAKNNDNVCGGQSGTAGDSFIAADGTVTRTNSCLGNGNGRDAAWVYNLQIKCAADGSTCDIQKLNDVVYIEQEERSRGAAFLVDTNADGTPDLSVATGTAGNSQPQRRGVWIAGVDVQSGDLLWNERIAYREETASGRRAYAMRIKSMSVKNLDGSNTGDIYGQYQMHVGRNNGRKKGGADVKMLGFLAKPDRNGPNIQYMADMTQWSIDARAEFTHSTMFQQFVGTNENPQSVMSFHLGNHNGNRVASSIVSFGVGDTEMSALGVTRMEAPYDHQRLSKNCGNNPNNQGRNYDECAAVPNAFANEQGPQQGVATINVCATVGKVAETSYPANVKADVLMETWISMTAPTPANPNPTPETGVDLPNVNPPTGSDNTGSTPGTPGTPSPGNSVGGCSVNGGSAGGSAAFVLFGLAIALRRRRRS